MQGAGKSGVRIEGARLHTTTEIPQTSDYLRNLKDYGVTSKMFLLIICILYCSMVEYCLWQVAKYCERQSVKLNLDTLCWPHIPQNGADDAFTYVVNTD